MLISIFFTQDFFFTKIRKGEKKTKMSAISQERSKNWGADEVIR